MQDDSTVNDNVDETPKPFVVGHIVIRDPDTGKVLVNKRDNNVKQLTAVESPDDV